VKVLAVYSIKGGVGKTASAVNLADLAARSGLRTLLWDLDPQGAASFYFRIKPKVKGGVAKLLGGRRRLDRWLRASDFEGLDLLPADFSYRNMDLVLGAGKKPRRRLARLLKPLAKRFDVVILDCPPSISLASESVFRAADALLLPIIPTPLSLRTHAQLVKHLREGGAGRLRLLPFFALVDRRKHLHREIQDAAPDEHPDFLTSWIPYSSAVEQMGTHRAPISTFAPRSHPALAYASLWEEIQSLVRFE
jgi:cellulose biosynthesis protein BcsQ